MSLPFNRKLCNWALEILYVHVHVHASVWLIHKSTCDMHIAHYFKRNDKKILKLSFEMFSSLQPHHSTIIRKQMNIPKKEMSMNPRRFNERIYSFFYFLCTRPPTRCEMWFFTHGVSNAQTLVQVLYVRWWLTLGSIKCIQITNLNWVFEKRIIEKYIHPKLSNRFLKYSKLETYKACSEHIVAI